MAKKGQTCRTCDATCCRLTLSYAYPPMTTVLDDFMSLVSQKCAYKMGFREFVPEPEKRHDCRELTENGLCKIHSEGKPRLCASYWCGGKWWSPKGVRLQVPAGEVAHGR